MNAVVSTLSTDVHVYTLFKVKQKSHLTRLKKFVIKKNFSGV